MLYFKTNIPILIYLLHIHYFHHPIIIFQDLYNEYSRHYVVHHWLLDHITSTLTRFFMYVEVDIITNSKEKTMSHHTEEEYQYYHFL